MDLLPSVQRNYLLGIFLKNKTHQVEFIIKYQLCLIVYLISI